MKERIKHLILLILLVGIDQGIKYWVKIALMNKEPFIIIPKVLNLQYCENSGAVWGIMSGRVDFLKIFTLIILIAIIYFYFKIPSGKKYNILKILAVFIVAGAIGNLIDRFLLGYVVDFIYFEIINFPLFNFADCCLTVSSILLFVLALFYYKDEDFAFLGSAFHKKEAGSISKTDIVSGNSSEDTAKADNKNETDKADE